MRRLLVGAAVLVGSLAVFGAYLYALGSAIATWAP